MTIPASEASYSRLSIVDVGRVFWWQGRLFRSIDADAEADIRRLFESGLVARLVAEGLLVDSWISTLELENCGLLIEHAPVAVPTYPREWSFTMLKEAARLVLDVNDVARQFGFQTKDCNGYNVLFSGGKPVFVDLGSFVAIPKDEDVLLSYEEFRLSYLFPLRIWQSAGHQLGSRCAPRAGGSLLPIESYVRFRWPFLRPLGDRFLTRWFKLVCSLRTLRHNRFQKIRKNAPRWTVPVLQKIKRLGLGRGPARIPSLRRQLDRLQHRGGATLWSGYHDPYAGAAELRGTPRFEHVANVLQTLAPGSILEIGGNQGVVSRMVRQRMATVRLTCSDPDSLAVDRGFQASSDAGEQIDWAVINPFASETSSLEIAPEERLRADAVVAMALTHHLTLSQGYRIGYVLDVIGSYASRSVLVEFMPLGLFDGTEGPTPPAWYTEEWFRLAFCARFELVERVQLESNRVLYVGRVADAPSAHGH